MLEGHFKNNIKTNKRIEFENYYKIYWILKY